MSDFLITQQQVLVLFDIAKTAMNQTNGFAGYSNETIMKLLNDIISQQNNTTFLNLLNTKVEIIKPVENKKVENDDFWE